MKRARVLPWPQNVKAPPGASAEFKEGLVAALQAAFAAGVKYGRGLERGRKMVESREARLGRKGWRAEAIALDHELCTSRPNLSCRARAAILARQMGLGQRTVYEALLHHPVYAHGQHPRRHRR